VFGEFETNLRRKRQMEGATQVKANGIHTGTPLRAWGHCWRYGHG
jgi:hypothetical protein